MEISFSFIALFVPTFPGWHPPCATYSAYNSQTRQHIFLLEEPLAFFLSGKDQSCETQGNASRTSTARNIADPCAPANAGNFLDAVFGSTTEIRAFGQVVYVQAPPAVCGVVPPPSKEVRTAPLKDGFFRVVGPKNLDENLLTALTKGGELSAVQIQLEYLAVDAATQRGSRLDACLLQLDVGSIGQKWLIKLVSGLVLISEERQLEALQRLCYPVPGPGPTQYFSQPLRTTLLRDQARRLRVRMDSSSMVVRAQAGVPRSVGESSCTSIDVAETGVSGRQPVLPLSASETDQIRKNGPALSDSGFGTTAPPALHFSTQLSPQQQLAVENAVLLAGAHLQTHFQHSENSTSSHDVNKLKPAVEDPPHTSGSDDGRPFLLAIRGPPGTGKTFTIAEIVHCWLQLGGYTACAGILLTAQSNAAVDQIGRQLWARGVVCVRFGHPGSCVRDFRENAEVWREWLRKEAREVLGAAGTFAPFAPGRRATGAGEQGGGTTGLLRIADVGNSLRESDWETAKGGRRGGPRGERQGKKGGASGKKGASSMPDVGRGSASHVTKALSLLDELVEEIDRAETAWRVGDERALNGCSSAG